MKPYEYLQKNLIDIEAFIVRRRTEVVLNGVDLSLNDLYALGAHQAHVHITPDKSLRDAMHRSYEVMISDITSGRPVYGSNTSFGGQADRVFNKGEAVIRLRNGRQLSESLSFLDVGTGPAIPADIVKAAMVIRVNMLLQGVSGVRLSSLETLLGMVNAGVMPLVGEYGGIGASGDLIHNERVVNAARGLRGVWVINEKGKKEPALTALKRHGIARLSLDPKEGLGLVNGDNFSTSMAAFIAMRLVQYLLLSTVTSAIATEVLRGTDRSFHPLLSAVRPHPGQNESASIYRMLLAGSRLAHNELRGHGPRGEGEKVQDAYSLRCLSQYDGVYIEELKNILKTITINANSVSDNPLWVPPDRVTEGEAPWQWVSGGNFLAMHMVESLDTLRKITTQLVKKNDRHLARLVDRCENNGMPSNLSDLSSITQCTFKGVQIQAGMFEIYSMVLATPVSTLFGVHEERNQDITSHATTSGVLALKNLDLLRFSTAALMIALAQAVDLRGGPHLLSPKTRPLYDVIRGVARRVTDDRPLSLEIESVAQKLETGEIMDYLRMHTFTL